MSRSPILEYATYNLVTAFTPPDDTPVGSLIITEASESILTETSDPLIIES